MTLTQTLCAVAIGAAVIFLLPLSPAPREGGALPGLRSAAAEPWGMDRRVARRTARRTTRRTTMRLDALPAGCPRSGPYYYCGGVYYQPVVEGGSTTYVIVTP